jgi:hypothetical protein
MIYSQARTRYVLYNTIQSAWMNRMADGLTAKMFNALWFPTLEDATHWLRESTYSPVDQYDFVVMETITIIQEVEDDTEHLPKTH